jgi:hypothetical protein
MRRLGEGSRACRWSKEPNLGVDARRVHHGGGCQSGGDASEVLGQGSPASIDESASSMWMGQSSWVGRLGWGVGGGSRHRRGARWRTDRTAPALQGNSSRRFNLRRRVPSRRWLLELGDDSAWPVRWCVDGGTGGVEVEARAESRARASWKKKKGRAPLGGALLL